MNMRSSELGELAAFACIAREGSFRRAAARLNLKPTTLSHTMRALETRLGVRLLNRTTRSISLTEAGRQLCDALEPALHDIETAVETVNRFRERPAGQLRISVPRSAAEHLILPLFRRFSTQYPDITLEVSANNGFVDIVREGFDAGIRLGESLAPGMIAVRITPDMRRAVVGSPGYFARHPAPQTPHDLAGHCCIGYRKIGSGELHRWAFAKGGEHLNVAVRGNLILDDASLMLIAATQGAGLAYSEESHAAPLIASGQLIRVLEDWCPPFAGFYLYYPGRRQVSAALRALINTLTRALTEDEPSHRPGKEDVRRTSISSLQAPAPSLDSLRGIARGAPSEGYRDRDDRDERY